MPGTRSESEGLERAAGTSGRARLGSRVAAAGAAGLVLLGFAASGRAEWPDWQALADVSVIQVLTTDADGDARKTRVWFVLVDGEPYLRTHGSRWLENLRRDPDCRLRIEGREYAVRAEEATGDAIVAAVDAASREKYGWQERLVHAFRRHTPAILRIEPRAIGE